MSSLLTEPNNLQFIKEMDNLYTILLNENNSVEKVVKPNIDEYKCIYNKLIATEYGDYNLGIITGFNLAISLQNKMIDINNNEKLTEDQKQEHIEKLKNMFLTGDDNLHLIFNAGYRLDSGSLVM